MKKFTDKIVIVTGGGSGIGRAAAVAFAREGASVVVADIVETEGRETIGAILAAGGQASYIATDVSHADSVNALVDATIAQHGRLDTYFSNAGILDRYASCKETDDALWAKVLAVNLSGCFYGARAALPHLIKTQGSVVMTASAASFGSAGAGTAYTASKHGVAGLVRQLAVEFAPLGVRVNGVAPGVITTNISRDQPEKPGVYDWAKEVTPLGRFGMPEEVAEPVLFLASSAASYVTGVLLSVDGGWRAK